MGPFNPQQGLVTEKPDFLKHMGVFRLISGDRFRLGICLLLLIHKPEYGISLEQQLYGI